MCGISVTQPSQLLFLFCLMKVFWFFGFVLQNSSHKNIKTNKWIMLRRGATFLSSYHIYRSHDTTIRLCCLGLKHKLSLFVVPFSLFSFFVAIDVILCLMLKFHSLQSAIPVLLLGSPGFFSSTHCPGFPEEYNGMISFWTHEMLHSS